jgi:SOS-response transcriptional repressor LexA
MNSKTTAKVVRLYRFLATFSNEHGYMPTIREMMPMIPTTSTSVARYYLELLVKLQWIVRKAETSRAIQLLKPLADLPDVSGLKVISIPAAHVCEVDGCERPVWDGPRGMHFRLTMCHIHQLQVWASESSERHGEHVRIIAVVSKGEVAT